MPALRRLPASEHRSFKHGAFSTLRLSEREEALVEELLETAAVVTPADPRCSSWSPPLSSSVLRPAALAQLDAATGQELGAYLSPQASAIEWIRNDQVRYLNAARKLAGDLGLNPTARLRMGLDLAMTRRTLSVIDYYSAREAEL